MDKVIGQRIRELRELKGYDKLYMASRLNLHTMYYTNLESGSKKASLPMLSRIAKLLETDVQYLLGGN